MPQALVSKAETSSKRHIVRAWCWQPFIVRKAPANPCVVFQVASRPWYLNNSSWTRNAEEILTEYVSYDYKSKYMAYVQTWSHLKRLCFAQSGHTHAHILHAPLQVLQYCFKVWNVWRIPEAKHAQTYVKTVQLWSICTCIYIYICIYIYTYIHTYIYTQPCTFKRTHTYTCTSKYTCPHNKYWIVLTLLSFIHPTKM